MAGTVRPEASSPSQPCSDVRSRSASRPQEHRAAPLDARGGVGANKVKRASLSLRSVRSKNVFLHLVACICVFILLQSFLQQVAGGGGGG